MPTDERVHIRFDHGDHAQTIGTRVDMSDAETTVQSGGQVYVVVESFIDGHRPEGVVHGVYSSEKLARIAAYHPYSSLKVLRLYLDSTPVDDAEDIDREDRP